MGNEKYPGVNPGDTAWDSHHKKNGMMTNHQFFSSNAKGGFYEGMEWDGGQWVPDAAARRREAEIEANNCDNCGCSSDNCWCN